MNLEHPLYVILPLLYKNAVQNMLYIIDILKLTGKRFLEKYNFDQINIV